MKSVIPGSGTRKKSSRRSKGQTVLSVAALSQRQHQPSGRSGGSGVAYHLDIAIYHTPKVSTSNLERLSSCEPSRLQVPAQFVKDRFFEVSEYPNRAQKVIQVIVERGGSVPAVAKRSVRLRKEFRRERLRGRRG